MGFLSALAVLSILSGPHQATAPPAQPHFLKVKPRFDLEAPLATAPAVMIDAYSSGVGAAQELAKSYSLQGRILWIDGTANIDRINTEQKIVDLVKQIKQSGFNTIVFDVKPISGTVLYKSAIAPKLTDWKGETLPSDFDPLAVMAREAKAAGLWIFASLNAFSEGHKLFQVGPGFEKREWQTIVYEPKPFLQLNDEKTYDIGLTVNKAEPGLVCEFTSIKYLPKDDGTGFAILVGKDFRMENEFDGPALALGLSPLPRGSTLFYGTGAAGLFLKTHYETRGQVALDTEPEFVPSSDPR